MTDGSHDASASTVTSTANGDDLPAGTRLAGRFIVERRIGTGGMGVVYRAHDESLGITVAIKLLRPELASKPEAFHRFRQELLLARQVSSPRVVRIHDIAEDGGRWFISMDFVEGTTLDRWLDGQGPVPVERAVMLARQIAEGLQAAHASGIVHRDLKPSNILLDERGEARIGDFGVARSIGATGLTQTGAVVGTPDYLSPEQARGAEIDARSDLYALGLILYEMLAGEPAFAGATPAESLARRLHARPDGLDARRNDLPRWLVRLVSTLLAPNPAHRCPDATAVLRAIDERRVPRRVRPVPMITGALGGVLLSAALWFWAPFAPDSAESAPPLPASPHRLVVVTAGPNDAPDPVLEGAAEALRLTLAERSEVAIVDGERTAIVQAQATLGAQGTLSDAALAESLDRPRVLRLSRDREGTAFIAMIDTADGDPRPITGPARPEPAAALRDLVPLAFSALQLSPATAPLPLRGDEDLEAYGRALRLAWSGRINDAADAFAAIVRGNPMHAPALVGLTETARQAGRRGEALDAARRLDGLPGRPFAAQASPWLAALDGRGDEAQAIAAQSAPEMAGDPRRRLRSAEIALEAGDLDTARSDLAVVLANDPQDPRGWFLMGKTAILAGDSRSAVDDHLVRALVLYKRARHPRGEAETVNALGVAYGRLGQVDDAEEQYGRALVLRRQLGDTRGTASSLRNLAQIDVFRGRHAEAAVRLEEARRLFAGLGDEAGIADIENELGVLHEEQGDYEAALAAYRRGLRSRERTDDDAGVAESLNNVGFAHYQLGDYDNALALWRQAREAFEAMGDGNRVVRVDQNLGLLAMARGEWREARRLLDGSLAAAESQQMLEEAAVSLRNLVELDLFEGHNDAAARRLERARSLFESRGDQRGLRDATLLGIRLDLARGDVAGAIERLDTPAEGEDPGSPEQQAMAALLRTRALLEAGRPADAETAAVEAARLAQRSGIRALQLEASALGAGAPEATLDDEIRQLGNVPLQLRWLERLAASYLGAGRRAEARAALVEAESLLGAGQPYAGREALESLSRRLEDAGT